MTQQPIDTPPPTVDDITPNRFDGSDSDRIQAAIEAATGTTNRVVIPARNTNGTNVWLLDRAILMPSNMTLVLDDCTVQLADSCIDNIIRSDNVGAGGTSVPWNHDIRIIGRGHATLRGASRPRSTGEGKTLTLTSDFDSPSGRGKETFGTDAGRDGCRQKGDWRNHGIVMAYVDGFELTDVTISHTHCWAITHERVRNAHLARIRIDNPPHTAIDGAEQYVANRDGINLRQGCKHFRIDDVSGETGDDFIAMTLLPAGLVDGDDVDQRLSAATATNPGYTPGDDDIEHITITNVACTTKNHGVAMRTIDQAKIRDVRIDGLITRGNPKVPSHQTAVLFGGRGYGPPSPAGCIRDVHIMNMIGDNRSALVHVEALISDCTFMNGIYSGPGEHVVSYHDFDDATPKYRTSEGNRGRDLMSNVREINLVATCEAHATSPDT
jgi:hypothetical protein